jgi:formylglycine-generating enzyme
VRSPARTVIVVGATLVVSTASCSLLVSIDGLTGGSADPDGAVAAAESGTESGTDGALASDADAGAGDSGDSGISREGCPTGKGPLPVRVAIPDGGFYCIDSTEVTRAQYDLFLFSIPTNTHARCGWNPSFVPKRAWPYTNETKDHPVVGVDWCDAYAYCAWAGKELCGTVTGGPVSPGARANPATAAFVHACSRGGTRTYSYGSLFDPNACNDTQYDAGGTIPVGSLPTCVGGFDGIFDLVGNAAEWADTCDGTTIDGGSDSGTDDLCYAYNSGYYESDSVDLKCNITRASVRGFADSVYGFRCCATP